MRKHYTLLHSGFTNLDFYQQCTKASFSLFPYQYLLFLIFFDNSYSNMHFLSMITFQITEKIAPSESFTQSLDYPALNKTTWRKKYIVHIAICQINLNFNYWQPRLYNLLSTDTSHSAHLSWTTALITGRHRYIKAMKTVKAPPRIQETGWKDTSKAK